MMGVRWWAMRIEKSLISVTDHCNIACSRMIGFVVYKLRLGMMTRTQTMRGTTGKPKSEIINIRDRWSLNIYSRRYFRTRNMNGLGMPKSEIINIRTSDRSLNIYSRRTWRRFRIMIHGLVSWGMPRRHGESINIRASDSDRSLNIVYSRTWRCFRIMIHGLGRGSCGIMMPKREIVNIRASGRWSLNIYSQIWMYRSRDMMSVHCHGLGWAMRKREIINIHDKTLNICSQTRMPDWKIHDMGWAMRKCEIIKIHDRSLNMYLQTRRWSPEMISVGGWAMMGKREIRERSLKIYSQTRMPWPE